MPTPAYAGANVSIGNGVTLAFPYNFKILDQAHLEVKIDGALKVLGADYTVTGVGLSVGGNVLMTAAPANGAVVQRARKVPYVRTQDYQNNGDFKELTVDNDFDTTEMQVQQLAADVARAFKAPLSVTADMVISDADWVLRAGRYVRVNALGTGIELASGAGPESSYAGSGVGALARSWTAKVGELVSVADYGAIGDGVTDNRVAVTNCFNYCVANGKTMFFPAGTWAFSNPGVHALMRPVTAPLRILGEGMSNTFLKNLSAGAGMVRLDYFRSEIRELTLDANNATYTALMALGYGCVVQNVKIKNQAGVLVPAAKIDGATQILIDNLELNNCATGVDFGETTNTYYPHVRRLVVGATTSGPALKMRRTTHAQFIDTYLEDGPVESLDISGCNDVLFDGFSGELAGGVALTTASYYLIDASEQIRFKNSGWINHTGTAAKKLFKTTGVCANIHFEDPYMLTTKAGMTLYSFEGAGSRNISVKKQRAYGALAFIGVSCGTAINRLTVDQWDTGGSGPCTHVFDAYRAFIKDVGDDFTIDTHAIGGTLINCDGNVTGASAYYIERLGTAPTQTFNPVLSFGGASVGIVYGSRYFRYSVVGGRCHFDVGFTLTNKGASVGQAKISLPMVAANNGQFAMLTGYGDVLAGGVVTQLAGQIDPNTFAIAINRFAAGAVINLTDADFTNTSVIRLSGSFEVKP